MIPCRVMPALSPAVVAAFSAFIQAAPTSSWPASAGAPPQVTPSEFRDPRAHYFDPPAGRYRLPDGTIQQADPPPGFYDPPPGHYPVDSFAGPAPDAVLGPLPTAEASDNAWLAKRRRLRIGLGISLGAIAVGAIWPSVATAYWERQRGPQTGVVEYAPGTMVALIVVPIGIVATIVSSICLGVHARRRPRPARIQVGAGGLRLSF